MNFILKFFYENGITITCFYSVELRTSDLETEFCVCLSVWVYVGMCLVFWIELRALPCAPHVLCHETISPCSFYFFILRQSELSACLELTAQSRLPPNLGSSSFSFLSSWDNSLYHQVVLIQRILKPRTSSYSEYWYILGLLLRVTYWPHCLAQTFPVHYEFLTFYVLADYRCL